ncbi:MAG: B12-binding domain-containing radical SAM protein [Candidatus Helarchaeota archaeon]
MLDILLINPRTELSIPSKKFNREPPTGILILYAVLRKWGYKVNFIDLSVESERRLKYLLDKNPRFLGITCLTNTYPLALSILKKIKHFNTNINTIIGGPHVSFNMEEALSEDFIDFVIIGEGEESLPYLLKHFNEKKAIENIYGLGYKKNGKIKFNSPVPIDLNNLPLPARDNLEKKYDVADIIVNRGCHYQCSFCVRQKLFQNVRIREPKHVINEINQIEQLEYDYFNLYDNINISRRFVDKLCSEMIKNEIDLPWGAELRIDLLDQKLAYDLVNAGCLAIATGIESGSTEVLKINNKNQDLNKIKRGILNAKRANLSIQAYFIIGLPGETKNTFEKTKEFINSLGLEPGIDRVNFFVATPYPGSDLYQNQEKFGISIIERNWELWDCEHIIFETNTLSKEDIEEMLEYGKIIEKKFAERD